MATLDQVIDLQITVTDKAPSRPNFGMPLLAGYHTAWLDRVRQYTNADDMLTDGFTAASPLYKMAVALKSQTPCPQTFKVGRLALPYTQTVQATVTSAVQGFVYTLEVNGTALSYTVPGAATLTSVATAIASLMSGVAGCAATSSVAVITATAAAGSLNSYYFDRGFTIKETTTDPGIATDLAAINTIDPAWYGLAIDCNAEAIIDAAAVWGESNKKLFAVQSSDSGVVDSVNTTDVASDLKALATTRTVGIYHRGIGRTQDWAAAAWLGVGLAADPGSITWAFKTLATISVDTLQAGERTSLATKYWSSYEAINAVNVTFEGKTGSGRFIDVTHFVDWLYATIQIDAFALLANAPKLPYTASGLAAIEGSIRGSLAKGKKNPNPGLDPDYQSQVTVPGVAAQSTTDRAARIVRGIEFQDRLSGALHNLIIRGRVSV